MTKAYLITPIARNFPVDKEAVYIGIDSGYQKILDAGLPLEKAIGDFDSVKPKGQPVPVDSIIYPVEKDETDAEIAMGYAIDAGYSPVILWGGLSGRLDHTIANLLAAGWQYPQVILEDEYHKVIVLLEGSHTILPTHKHVSFFALEDSLITLENFKYNAVDRLLGRKDIYAVSNSFLDGREGKLNLQWGRVLCILSNEE